MAGAAIAAAAALAAVIAIEPASTIDRALWLKHAALAPNSVPVAISAEAADTETAANATLVWATGEAAVTAWVDSTGRWVIDPAQLQDVTICEGAVYIGGAGDPRCTAEKAAVAYACPAKTTASCVGPNGTDIDSGTFARYTVVWGNNGTAAWAFDRPEKTGGMVFCWVLLVVINALRTGAFKRRLSRMDAAALAGGGFIIRATSTVGAVAPPHIFSETGTAAIDYAAGAVAATVAAVAIAVAATAPTTQNEPYRGATEVAALAAIAAAFPQSVAGTAPATVVSIMSGLAISVVAGRSKSVATAPAIVWSAAALVYPAITDAIVTESRWAAAAVAAAVTVTTASVAVAVAE